MYELMLCRERAHAHSGDLLGMNTYTCTRALSQVFTREKKDGGEVAVPEAVTPTAPAEATRPATPLRRARHRAPPALDPAAAATSDGNARVAAPIKMHNATY
jgi:hypothetical protein